MKLGDIVERKNVLGFKGILIEKIYALPETLDPPQLSLYDRHEWSRWKVLWFKHPYEAAPCVHGVMEKNLYKSPQRSDDQSL